MKSTEHFTGSPGGAAPREGERTVSRMRITRLRTVFVFSRLVSVQLTRK